MNSTAILPFLLVFAALVRSEDTISLHGKVTGLDGLPVEGAVVRLALRGQSAASGSDGAYHITSSSGSTFAAADPGPRIALEMIQGALVITLSRGQNVSIDELDLRGSTARVLHSGPLRCGAHRFRFLRSGRADGVRLLRVRSTEGCAVHKVLCVDGAGRFGSSRHGLSVGVLRKTRAAACDTLEVTHAKYDTARVPICTLFDTTHVTLVRTSGCDKPAPLDVSNATTVVGDGTPGSVSEQGLRDAVAAGGTVVIDPGCRPVTIAMSSTIVVGNDVVVDGGGRVSLDGGGQNMIFFVKAGKSLGLQGLTLANGSARGQVIETWSMRKGGAVFVTYRGTLDIRTCRFLDNKAVGDPGDPDNWDAGGAVFAGSEATVTIANSLFSDNSAGVGGALHNMLSDLTIVNSIFARNRGGSMGGAVGIDGAMGTSESSTGTIRLCGCEFRDNYCEGGGGGVFSFLYDQAQTLIDRCVFACDSAAASGGMSLGGGLRHGNGVLALTSSTFEGCVSLGQGGALSVSDEKPMTVTNCTFFGNKAFFDNNTNGYGGAIKGSNLTILHCTIADNESGHASGGIFSEGSVTVKNTILSNNTTNCCCGVTDGGNNLAYPNANGCPSSITVGDPLLGALADNGGFARTMALGEGSPAIDAASGGTATDQRGCPRSGAADMGAFERQ